MGGRRNRKRRGRSTSDGIAEQLISGSSGTLSLNRYLQIKQSDEIGRYLIASEDLLPGTILLQEDPIVIGPNFGLDATCIRCGQTIQSASTKDQNSRCVNCEWPVCQDLCQGVDHKDLHSLAECETLAKASKKPRGLAENKLFNIITPLRVLHTRKHEPEKWALIQELESHNEIRKINTDQWRFYQTEVVDVIKEVCAFQEFTDDEVHTVCGYLQGTIQRRAYLKESKYFECKCERCKDPTELGTYFSSLRCRECEKGFQVQENPLDADSPWVCQNNRCGFTENSTAVSLITQTAHEEIDNVREKGVQFWEDFMRKYEGLLHPNHHLLTMAKCSLSQLYGKVPNYMIDQLSVEHLQRKIKLCEDVLKLSDVFEPGLSRLRGITMYELHAPLLLYAIKNFQTGKSNKELLKRRLRVVVKYLEEAAKILSFEDPSSAEGKILGAIETALKETKTWETQLKNV